MCPDIGSTHCCVANLLTCSCQCNVFTQLRLLLVCHGGSKCCRRSAGTHRCVAWCCLLGCV